MCLCNSQEFLSQACISIDIELSVFIDKYDKNESLTPNYCVTYVIHVQTTNSLCIHCIFLHAKIMLI